MRGPKPKGKVKIEWSPNFAYALGLLASDGCLSNDGRHITLVSKDIEQLENFNKCMQISVKIGIHHGSNDQIYHRVQWSDIPFYTFLQSIGFSPAKSLILPQILIPHNLFFDFLRGEFDGDGYTHSYMDKRWKSSYMFYIGFCSASPVFINWLKFEIESRIDVRGHITKSRRNPCLTLKYSKYQAIKILYKLYSSPDAISLSRKKLKIDKMLDIVRLKL